MAEVSVHRVRARTSTQCGVTASLTPADLTALDALPRPVDPPLRSLVCELAEGHDGSHVAFTVAAHDGDQWWWLHWTGSQRRLGPLDRCDAEPPSVADLDCCLLPLDHEGPHSFALVAP
jgi:hypothetical protein